MVQLAMALDVTLPYQARNKWVAANENASLRQLMTAAKKGARTFAFHLPADERDVGVARVVVLRDILEKSAGNGVTLVEAEGTTAPNTLWVEVR